MRLICFVLQKYNFLIGTTRGRNVIRDSLDDLSVFPRLVGLVTFFGVFGVDVGVGVGTRTFASGEKFLVVLRRDGIATHGPEHASRALALPFSSWKRWFPRRSVLARWESASERVIRPA